MTNPTETDNPRCGLLRADRHIGLPATDRSFVSEVVEVDQFELDAVRRENQLNDGFNVPLADVDAVVANVEMVDDYDVREVADTSEPDREDYGRFAVNLIVPPRRSVTRDKHGKATVTIHYPANRPEYEGW